MKSKQLEYETFQVVKFDAVDGAEEGTVEAIVSAYGVVNRMGSRIVAGAFKKSIAERGFPTALHAHQWNLPALGYTLEAEEVAEGLRVVFRYFMDIEYCRWLYLSQLPGNGDGTAPIREYSIGYLPTKSRYYDEDDKAKAAPDHYRDVEEGELYEFGPCLVGMNPKTRTIGIEKAPDEDVAEDTDEDVSTDADEAAEDVTDAPSCSADTLMDADRLARINDLLTY